jgi:hypothetical protein
MKFDGNSLEPKALEKSLAGCEIKTYLSKNVAIMMLWDQIVPIKTAVLILWVIINT